MAYLTSFFERLQWFGWTFAAVCGLLLGGWDGLMKMLVLAIILDYISGALAAVHHGEFDKWIGLWGITKKVMYAIPVALANGADMWLLQGGGVLRAGVMGLLIANDGISILDNLERAGIPVLEKLRDFFKGLGTKSND